MTDKQPGERYASAAAGVEPLVDASVATTTAGAATAFSAAAPTTGAPTTAAPTTAAARSSAGRGTTREAILEAARAELGETGDFSVNGVAARAGVTRQSVQYHFGGARGLRDALAAEGLLQPAPSESTKERLIDAAVRMFSSPGGAVASIDAIAAEAGLSKGAIYHHFEDRREFLQAVAERVTPVDEIVAVLDATRDGPLREGLIALATAYYRVIRSRAGLVRSLAANASTDPDLGDMVIAQIVGRGAPVMFGWFGERVARGEIRPLDVPFVAQALFGPAFLAIVLGDDVFRTLQSTGIRPAVDNVEEYVDFLLRGISPADAAEPADAAVTADDTRSANAPSINASSANVPSEVDR